MYTENNMGAEVGIFRHGSLINLDVLSVRMTNLNIAARAYETNIGLLSRYKQMRETKMELLG
jgi:flagellar basal body rod protein FlgC